jgi:two-component system, OmpR family, phosphate regulon sensor histidine kinase PhoR
VAAARRDDAIAAALLDDARDGLVALDEHGTIIEVNEAAANRLGRSRVHLIGKPFVAFVRLEQRRAFRSAILHLEPEGVPTRLTLELGDAVQPFTAVLRALPRTSTRVVSLALLADQAFALPPRPTLGDDFRVDRFFLRFPQGVIGIRRDRKVAFANQLARRLLGRDAVRVGRPLGQIEIGLNLAAIIDRLLSHRAPLAPAEMPTEDGRTLRVAGLGASDDDPAVILLEDVTAQHRRDQPMREFVRNAAHQLRTPLTGIATAVEVLENGAKDDPVAQARFLQHIRQHTDRLIRLSRGLLVLAQAQSGAPVRLEFVELQPLLETLTASMNPAARVTIVTECPASLAALAERDLVHEALAALVENAVKFTRNGQVRLTAWDGDGTVTIEVADDGPGILPEQRARILEPFHRIADDGESFGLGLAIAAQAVAAMGGHLVTGDSPSGGTTFAVRLPSARIVR